VLQKAWQSGVWWLRWLPLLFLLMQYPLLATVLLMWNWTAPRTTGFGGRLAAHLAAAWAWLVLSATLWLVDIAAVFILLSSSAIAVTGGLQQSDVLWWVLLPLEYLHWILPTLRLLCFSKHLPAVATILQPAENAEDVWAENHMFARMPMEALLEALPQMVLQALAFFLAPGPEASSYKPSLLVFMFSVTLSLISIGKSLFYIHEARKPVRLSYVQSLMLLLQLKGSFRVPAALMQDGKQDWQQDSSGNRQSIKVPAELTPLQQAGFIRAKLASYSKLRIAGNQATAQLQSQPSKWTWR
jgi:hypothetical protein